MNASVNHQAVRTPPPGWYPPRQLLDLPIPAWGGHGESDDTQRECDVEPCLYFKRVLFCHYLCLHLFDALSLSRHAAPALTSPPFQETSFLSFPFIPDGIVRLNWLFIQSDLEKLQTLSKTLQCH